MNELGQYLSFYGLLKDSELPNFRNPGHIFWVEIDR